MLTIFSSLTNYWLVLKLIFQTSFSWQISEKSNIILTWKLNRILIILFCSLIKRFIYSKFLIILMLMCMQKLILLSWLRILSNHSQFTDDFTKSLKRIKFINFVRKLNLKSKSSWFFYLFIFFFCSTRLWRCESSCVHVIYYCMLVTFSYATAMWILDVCLLSSWHKHSKSLWHSIFLDILSWIFVCICCFTLFLECFDLSLLSTQNSCSLMFFFMLFTAIAGSSISSL